MRWTMLMMHPPPFRHSVLKGMVDRWYGQAQSGNTQADEAAELLPLAS